VLSRNGFSSLHGSDLVNSFKVTAAEFLPRIASPSVLECRPAWAEWKTTELTRPLRQPGRVNCRLPARETDVLARVIVRLFRERERPEYDRLLEKKHYLHESALTGKSLGQSAGLDSHRGALLAYIAAALHLKAREK